jgi:hypothetical protein
MPPASCTALPPLSARESRTDQVAGYWHPWAGESPAAAASVRIEIPSIQAGASAQARSRSGLFQAPPRPGYSRQYLPFPPPGGHPVRFVAPLLPASRDRRQEHVRDLSEFDRLEIEQFFLIY